MRLLGISWYTAKCLLVGSEDDKQSSTLAMYEQFHNVVMGCGEERNKERHRTMTGEPVHMRATQTVSIEHKAKTLSNICSPGRHPPAAGTSRSVNYQPFTLWHNLLETESQTRTPYNSLSCRFGTQRWSNNINRKWRRVFEEDRFRGGEGTYCCDSSPEKKIQVISEPPLRDSL